jgi:hypothetical protein
LNAALRNGRGYQEIWSKINLEEFMFRILVALPVKVQIKKEFFL